MPSRDRSHDLSTKTELRTRLRQALADIPSDDLATKSLQACHRLFEQKEYIKSEVIMVFLSLPTEVDTTPIVLRAWQDRKRVLAPKVSWNQRRMLPLEIRSLTDDLVVSNLGIREPVSGIPFPIRHIDMVIVPGLGFDEYGNRLGRGRGFYDRFLAHPEFTGTSCGLSLSQQVVSTVPVGPLDQSIHMLVTDADVYRFSKPVTAKRKRG